MKLTDLPDSRGHFGPYGGIFVAETGAAQHGVASATVAARYGMECVVYMGAEDVERQAPNVFRMKLLGATVVPVSSGSKTLKDALNEAMTRFLPMRRANKAWPMVLLILCAPVWLRSSRLR